MSALFVGGLVVFAIVVLVLSGLHVPIALLAVSFVGTWLLRGSFDVAMSFTAQAAMDSIASHEYGVVPLFVLMGMLVAEARIAHDLFAFAHRIFGRLKGSMGIATVFANALFASITGVSIASAAVFSRVSVPVMLKLGYTPQFSAGVVAGSSVLGMLIPPSVLMIVFAFLTNQSVGGLFVAGIVPGLLLALAFTIGILLLAYLRPDFVGGQNVQSAEYEETDTMVQLVWRLWPICVLMILMMGGLYTGFFTATEAGAVGAGGALVLALIRRALTPERFRSMLIETGHITVSVLFLIIAANLYSRTLSLSGVPQFIVRSISENDIGPGMFLVMYFGIIILLGCLIDSVSIMMIVVPVMYPMAVQFGFEPAWLGVTTVIAVEIGLLTPPFGVIVYVVRSSVNLAEVGLREIFIGSFPFFVIMLLVLIIIVLFPQIVFLI